MTADGCGYAAVAAGLVTGLAPAAERVLHHLPRDVDEP